jgi:dTDP-4-amino-4,6-dideoxygalactose transaminase
VFVFDEIGSEYWKADIKDNVENKIEGAVFTASGRSAQALIVKSIDQKKKKALLPAYTCQHIVEPFTWNGWCVDFYDIDDHLEVKKDSLISKLADNPSCVVVQSYYGFNTIKSMIQIISEAQRDGCTVIEDVTHCFLSEFHNFYPNADFRFCSLRKWSGISDGGYAVSCCDIELEKPTVSMDKFFTERHAARNIKAIYKDTGNSKLKEEYLRLYSSSEKFLDSDIGLYSMSVCGYEDFKHLDFDFIKCQRRENYYYILKNLKSKYVRPIFETLNDVIVPITFPVFMFEKRQELRQYLIDNRIYCSIHWPQPIQLTDEAKHNNSNIYNTIMSIPCDQRYTPNMLERMVSLINRFE